MKEIQLGKKALENRPPEILKTEAEYEKTLQRVETRMDASPGSAEENELKLWSLLVERYEEVHFAMALPNPVEAIKFRMDQERPLAKSFCF